MKKIQTKEYFSDFCWHCGKKTYFINDKCTECQSIKYTEKEEVLDIRLMMMVRD